MSEDVLWNLADVDKDGKIGAHEAPQFFRLSGLPDSALSEVLDYLMLDLAFGR